MNWTLFGAVFNFRIHCVEINLTSEWLPLYIQLRDLRVFAQTLRKNTECGHELS